MAVKLHHIFTSSEVYNILHVMGHVSLYLHPACLCSIQTYSLYTFLITELIFYNNFHLRTAHLDIITVFIHQLMHW
jgi:hypothetical protein